MIKIIVATDLNNAIGYNNELLFNISEDLKRFKELTTGHFVVMGRKTYESLPKGALPKRINVVLTRDEGYDPKNPAVVVEHNINKIINHYNNSGKQQKDLWIIGGEEIYKLFLPFTDQIYLTEVFKEVKEVDVFFPKLDESKWESGRKEFFYCEKYNCIVQFKVLNRI